LIKIAPSNNHYKPLAAADPLSRHPAAAASAVAPRATRRSTANPAP